jgi:hypothetical protein
MPLSKIGPAGASGEFANLPFLVEIIPPRAGYVYVTRESNEKIIPGNEMYNRMLIEDGTLPKEVEEQVYQQMVEDKKQDMASNKDDRRKYGETAPLRLKLITVKTANDGDCFFDAVCKAFTDTTVTRHADMWAAAFHGADLPDPTEPLSIRELRSVVAAHFTEEQFELTAAVGYEGVGGEGFAYVCPLSIDVTRANIRACAKEAGDAAYWADEMAISTLQRYLGVRLLIFNPVAHGQNQCYCVGKVTATQYIILRHSHRANKVQHYELYRRPPAQRHGAPGTAIFSEESLPNGVRNKFAHLCSRAEQDDGGGGNMSYDSQLLQLQQMGFSNEAASRRALVQAGGDVERAINFLCA